jgi:hypothetical protein
MADTFQHVLHVQLEHTHLLLVTHTVVIVVHLVHTNQTQGALRVYYVNLDILDITQVKLRVQYHQLVLIPLDKVAVLLLTVEVVHTTQKQGAHYQLIV